MSETDAIPLQKKPAQKVQLKQVFANQKYEG